MEPISRRDHRTYIPPTSELTYGRRGRRTGSRRGNVQLIKRVASGDQAGAFTERGSCEDATDEGATQIVVGVLMHD